MQYIFDWSWFGIGLLILLAGAAVTIWHKPIADNLGSGVSSYQRYQLFGLIACGVGLICMINLHSFLLGLIFRSFFGAGQ